MKQFKTNYLSFLSLFLTLEVQSIGLYILCSYIQSRNSSVEAGLKYFVVGAVSTGFLLLGISFIYGGSGTLSFNDFFYLFKIVVCCSIN